MPLHIKGTVPVRNYTYNNKYLNSITRGKIKILSLLTMEKTLRRRQTVLMKLFLLPEALHI